MIKQFKYKILYKFVLMNIQKKSKGPFPSGSAPSTLKMFRLYTQTYPLRKACIIFKNVKIEGEKNLANIILNNTFRNGISYNVFAKKIMQLNIKECTLCVTDYCYGWELKTNSQNFKII